MYEIDPAPLSVTLDTREREHDISSPSDDNISPAGNMLPAVLRGLDVSKVETRTDLVRELSRTIPLNEYNLPIYIYRPDLLDPQMLLQKDRTTAKNDLADMLSGSIKNVSYDFGFPTLDADKPFWAQMQWETRDAFSAFLQYLELPGARSFHSIENVAPDLLREWAVQNYWIYRSQAYDAFKVAHHTRMRERRIFEVQDNHYQKSNKLLEKVYQQLDNATEEDFKNLGFDKLVSSFEKIAKVQRESLGMGANGGLGKDGQLPTGTSVEVVMRRAAEVNHPTRKIDDTLVDMEGLLNDPEALSQAQELIIRVNK